MLAKVAVVKLSVKTSPLIRLSERVTVAVLVPSYVLFTPAAVTVSASGLMLAVAEASFSANTATQGYFVLLIAAAILGGPGKPYGAVAGALIIGMVVNVTSIWINPQLTTLIGFGARVLVVPHQFLFRLRSLGFWKNHAAADRCRA